MSELDAIRQYYAEELRAVVNLQSEALVRAFAKVPREHFLGPGPWQILNPYHLIEDSDEASYYRETADADPKQLYHNILVAIDAKRCLNNGQPSFLAILIDSLELIPGDRVVHIGCGTGYYSAIMAEVVGPKGHVTAVEVDSELATLAQRNLKYLSYVEVVEADGGSIDLTPSDGILVNAGATHPRATWLDSLRVGGRLLLPLTVSNESDAPESGQVLKITRQENVFTASFICQTTIFPCSGARDPELNDKLMEAFKRGDAKSVQSLRRDPHNEQESCWLHGKQFCLSKTSIVT
jgi:protein-L-isoaspartate(D-aspartate) O-methyltransferase